MVLTSYMTIGPGAADPAPSPPAVPAYYVDATLGSDSADGLSSSTPWKTVAKVNVAAFSTIHTVYFKNGEVFSGATLKPPISGSASQFILFDTYGSGPKAILTAASVRDYAVDTNGMSYLAFSGLDIQGGNDGGLYIHNSHHILIDACEVHDNFNFGILTYSATPANIHHETIINSSLHHNGRWGYQDGLGHAQGGGGNLLYNCDVYLNGWRVGGGVFATGGVFGDFTGGSISHSRIYSNGLGDVGSALNHGVYIGVGPQAHGGPVIEYNLVYDNRSYGIQARSSATIRYNECYGNEQGGIIVGDATFDLVADLLYDLCHGNGRGVVAGKFGNVGSITLRVENNTLALNHLTTQIAAGSALKIADDLASLTVKNNLLVSDGSRRTYEINKPLTHAVFAHNLAWRTTGGAHVGYNTALFADKTWAQWLALGFETASQEANPLLNGDYTLQAGSPARDQGTALGLALDLAGTPVPQGAFPDIGAFEYV